MPITRIFNVISDTIQIGRTSTINVDAVSVSATAHYLTISGTCHVALAFRDSVAVVAVPAETMCAVLKHQVMNLYTQRICEK